MCAHKISTSSRVWGNYRTLHKMLKMAVSKAAASEMARRTLRYVEPLSDVRTTLAAIFSILLGSPCVLG
jgi:hypothetical protein